MKCQAGAVPASLASRSEKYPAALPGPKGLQDDPAHMLLTAQSTETCVFCTLLVPLPRVICPGWLSFITPFPRHVHTTLKRPGRLGSSPLQHKCLKDTYKSFRSHRRPSRVELNIGYSCVKPTAVPSSMARNIWESEFLMRSSRNALQHSSSASCSSTSVLIVAT